eukprot:gene13326-19165_t
MPPGLIFFSSDLINRPPLGSAHPWSMHDIHFWHGKDSSKDQQASAALHSAQGGLRAPGFKSVDPEVNYTSPLTLTTLHSATLLQLCPRVIDSKGGLQASGFKSVGDTKDPIKLHHVRSDSRTSCQVYEVPASVDSLNSGDAFIAEGCSGKSLGDSFISEEYSGKALFIWYGSSTNVREKMKAVEAATALKAAHGGAVRVAVVDEGELDSTDTFAFFNLLGVSNPASVSIRSADAVSAPSSTSSNPSVSIRSANAVSAPSSNSSAPSFSIRSADAVSAPSSTSSTPSVSIRSADAVSAPSSTSSTPSVSIRSADAVPAPSSTSSVFKPNRLFKASSGANSELPTPLSKDQLMTDDQFGLVAAG